MARYHAMYKTLLCCTSILIAASAQAEPAPGTYDFRSIIPHDWRAVPPPQSLNARGFVSPDGNSKIVLYAKRAIRPVAAQLGRLRTVPGGDITYEREGRSWIVVSGFKGNRIFYRKAMLACGGRAWHYLEFEYPANQKRAFDEFVTRSSMALGAYARRGCEGMTG